MALCIELRLDGGFEPGLGGGTDRRLEGGTEVRLEGGTEARLDGGAESGEPSLPKGRSFLFISGSPRSR
jgi:hypothetical protein